MRLVATGKQMPAELRALSGSAETISRRCGGVEVFLEKVEGSSITFALPDTFALAGDAGSFPVGTLVELTTPSRIFLGEVATRQGTTGTIRAEHELERSAVDAIQAAWGGAAGA